MMFIRRYARLGAWFALGLFSGFLGFSVYLAMTGIEAECGCFGKAIQSGGGGWLIIRNGIFLSMVLWLLAGKEVAHEKAAIQ
ncbi:MAG: hypothetical protein Q9P14_16595 [candidate division KSB1 bacterium]|nr:hypothetical protein [candidate division KSB1 bacterium]